MATTSYRVERWTRQSRLFAVIIALVLMVLAIGPFIFSADITDRLTTLFVYVILAAMWNAMAGYAGLVSIGNQVFIGLGGYFLIRLSDAGVSLYPAVVLAALIVGLIALPVGELMLRLRGGEFAIGMWVLAELSHFLVNLDPVIQGETGTSLTALNAYPPVAARNDTYWVGFVLMVVLLAVVFALLRGRVGAGVQAIRDDEVAAASVGVKVHAGKRIMFVLAAIGCAAAGGVWLATTISFQPGTFFGIQWTAYMLFMALVGGLGTFEGPIIGAILFFIMESWFGATGVAYLIGLGVTALAFSLFLPRGIWGSVETRLGIRLLPVGFSLRLVNPDGGRDRD
ncbi:MAG: branched-chain amino acid ABC transporter permease [Acidocella sp.]|nr:branched-chain amino acid ABC transporter permease [Acidocella sp.]